MNSHYLYLLVFYLFSSNFCSVDAAAVSSVSSNPPERRHVQKIFFPTQYVTKKTVENGDRITSNGNVEMANRNWDSQGNKQNSKATLESQILGQLGKLAKSNLDGSDEAADALIEIRGYMRNGMPFSDALIEVLENLFPEIMERQNKLVINAGSAVGLIFFDYVRRYMIELWILKLLEQRLAGKEEPTTENEYSEEEMNSRGHSSSGSSSGDYSSGGYSSGGYSSGGYSSGGYRGGPIRVRKGSQSTHSSSSQGRAKFPVEEEEEGEEDRYLSTESTSSWQSASEGAKGSASGQKAVPQKSNRARKREMRQRRKAAAQYRAQNGPSYGQKSQFFEESESPKEYYAEDDTSDKEISDLTQTLHEWSMRLRELQRRRAAGTTASHSGRMEEMQNDDSGFEDEEESTVYTSERQQNGKKQRLQKSDGARVQGQPEESRRRVIRMETEKEKGNRAGRSSKNGSGNGSSSKKEVLSKSAQQIPNQKRGEMQSSSFKASSTVTDKRKEGNERKNKKDSGKNRQYEEPLESDMETERMPSSNRVTTTVKETSPQRRTKQFSKIEGDSQDQTNGGKIQKSLQQSEKGGSQKQGTKQSVPSHTAYNILKVNGPIRTEETILVPNRGRRIIKKIEEIESPEGEMKELTGDDDGSLSADDYDEMLAAKTPLSMEIYRKISDLEDNSAGNDVNEEADEKIVSQSSNIVGKSRWTDENPPNKSIKTTETIQSGGGGGGRTGGRKSASGQQNLKNSADSGAQKQSSQLSNETESNPGRRRVTKTIVETVSPGKRVVDSSRMKKQKPGIKITNVLVENQSEEPESLGVDNSSSANESLVEEEEENESTAGSEKVTSEWEKEKILSETGLSEKSEDSNFDSVSTPGGRKVTKIIEKSRSPGKATKQLSQVSENLGSGNANTLQQQTQSKGPRIFSKGEKVIDSSSMDGWESFESMERDDAEGNKKIITSYDEEMQSAPEEQHQNEEIEEESTIESENMPWERRVTKIIEESTSPGRVVRKISKSGTRSSNQVGSVQGSGKNQAHLEESSSAIKEVKGTSKKGIQLSAVEKTGKKSGSVGQPSASSVDNKVRDRKLTKLVEESPTPGGKSRRFLLTETVDPRTFSTHSFDELAVEEADVEHEPKEAQKALPEGEITTAEIVKPAKTDIKITPDSAAKKATTSVESGPNEVASTSNVKL